MNNKTLKLQIKLQKLVEIWLTDVDLQSIRVNDDFIVTKDEIAFRIANIGMEMLKMVSTEYR